ncbi:MAG: TonB family protein [candidate division WOR-3 bacterium]
MFAQQKTHTLEIALLISAVFHVMMIFLISRSREAIDTGFDLQEVTFMDVTYRPEVAKITRASGTGQGLGQGKEPPAYFGGGAEEEAVPFDMSTTLERSPSQARIELERYELAQSEEMDVIRLGGKGSAQTTEEILSQAPIVLERSGGGSGGALGLRGVPGIPHAPPQPQLSLERRAVDKPASTQIIKEPLAQPQPTVSVPVGKGTSFQIAGPIRERQILKKVKPRYPKWALDQHISGKVTVRIWVLPNGQVKGIPQVVISSGYPDLDLVVVEALQLWEFAPLGPGVKSEEQWGEVTFIFQLA